MILVFLATPSEGQLKFPLSNLNALNFRFPPRTRTSWIRFAPIRVFAGWRPSSNFRFLRYEARCAPVAARLWRESREIPILSPQSVLVHESNAKTGGPEFKTGKYLVVPSWKLCWLAIDLGRVVTADATSG